MYFMRKTYEYKKDKCPQNIRSVIIPNSITEIEDSAFFKYRNLTHVVIGNGVTKIGNWAFSGCENLTEIIISDSEKYRDN